MPTRIRRHKLARRAWRSPHVGLILRLASQGRTPLPLEPITAFVPPDSPLHAGVAAWVRSALLRLSRDGAPADDAEIAGVHESIRSSMASGDEPLPRVQAA